MSNSKLPSVPETILKRRKRQAENRASRAQEVIKVKVARKHKRATIFKRAEKYAKEYQDQARDEIRFAYLIFSVGKIIKACKQNHLDILGPAGTIPVRSECVGNCQNNLTLGIEFILCSNIQLFDNPLKWLNRIIFGIKS